VTDLQRVLYVEDDLEIQSMAQVALEMIGGFTVHVCSSGKQALIEAENFAPDMILLDVMMPDLDGPDTLKGLREQAALDDVPIAFMTAKVQPNEVAHLKSLGAMGVIAKPFDPRTLCDQLRKIWQLQCASTAI
jgi:two-component system, OmpR family, response regulator